MLFPRHVLAVLSKHAGAGNSVRSPALFSCLPWWATHPPTDQHCPQQENGPLLLGPFFFFFLNLSSSADLRLIHFGGCSAPRCCTACRWPSFGCDGWHVGLVFGSGSEGLLEEKKQCGKRKQKLCCSLYLLPS